MGDVISRRDLLKASAISAVGYSVVRPLEAIAGPFTIQDYRNLVPRDKKLDPAWVRGLTERGEEPWVSGDDLKFIGMPIGGLFAGTVYLGGDGTLWNWDIFNQHHQGGVDRPGGVQYGDENLSVGRGANYVDPPGQRSPFKLQFSLDVDGKMMSLDRNGWDNVEFLGQYPVGTIRYANGSTPIIVELQSFSPFIPLDVERSSYPATVLRYKVTNRFESAQEIRLGVQIQHPALIHSGIPENVRLIDIDSEGGDAIFKHYVIEEEQEDLPELIDILFEDWESGTYDGWTVTGSAFGQTPRRKSDIADYQGDLGSTGEWVVNTHNTCNGEDVREADVHTGQVL